MFVYKCNRDASSKPVPVLLTYAEIHEIARSLFGLAIIVGFVFCTPVFAAVARLSTGQQCEYAQAVLDSSGNLTVTCAALQPPVPTTPVPLPPTPTPTPTPTAGCTSKPATILSFIPGGYNNYITTNTAKVAAFHLPETWVDGTELIGGGVFFAPTPGTETVDYEVAFSACPGDFNTTGPCHVIGGATMEAYWIRDPAWAAQSCYIPNGRGYMNWRPINCRGYCGQTFYVPRG